MRLAHLSAPVKALVLFLATAVVVACLAPLIGEPVEERSALWVVTDRALVRVGLDTDGTHRTTDPIPGAAAAEVRVRGNRLITARADAITSHALTPTLQPGEGTTVAMDAAAVSGLAASADADHIWLARPVPHWAGDAGPGNKHHSNGPGHGAGPASRITAFDRDLMPQWQRDLPGRIVALASAPADQDDTTVWVLQPRQLVGLDEAGATMVSLPLPPGPPARAFVPLENQRFAVADVRGVRLLDAAGQVLAGQRLIGTGDLHPLTGDEPSGLLWAVGRHRLALLDEQLQPVRTWHLPAQALARPVAASTVDPRDDSLWFVAGDSLYNAESDGALTEHRDLFAYLGTDPVTDLALYADTFAPELIVIEPEEPLVTNNDQPDLVLEYDDTGIGVDTDTLNVEQDGEPVDGTCETDTEAQRIECVIGPFDDGTHTITATVADYAGNVSETAEATYEIDTVAPEITIESPADGAFVNTEQVTISGQLSETAELTIDGEPTGLDIDNRFEQVITLDSDGTSSIELEATDGAGNRTTRTLTVIRDTVAPPAVIAAGLTVEAGDEAGQVRITGAEGSAEPEAEVVITNTRTGEEVVVQANADGAFVAGIAGEVGDTYEIVVRDAAGNESEPEPVTGVDEDVPPDPADIAPPLPETGIPPFEEQISFLYEGNNAIQQDVVPGTIEARRVSVLRGNVKNRAGEPIPGVRITILNHPELGHTATQADGDFDLAINGGGALTVEYKKDGYLPVQRTVSTQWNGWYHADDVVMIQLDDQVTTIDLTDDSQPFQVAQGSVVTDADGTRQTTVLFPAGTTAEITLPDGTKKQLSQLDVRATEYTVGDTGPAAMPGELPPASAYTYAVELSVDQALEQGVKVQGKDVVFNQPVPVYVDNFLDFPVGEPVPVGYYNNDTAAWVPHDNGRIIDILEEQGGRAVLDVTGDGEPATQQELDVLNITADERAQLARLYAPGDSVWRMVTRHLSTWDHNWPYGPAADAEAPDVPDPDSDEPENSDEEEDCEGCSISPQRQSVSESIEIAGTPFSLNYRSSRMPGAARNSIDLQVTGPDLPNTVRNVKLRISIAGQVINREFDPEPDQTYEFAWDGKDGFGRQIQGDALAIVDITHVYGCRYLASGSDRRRSFARYGDVARPIGSRSRCQGFELSQRLSTRLDPGTGKASGSIGNWDVSVEQRFNAASGQLIGGEGDERSLPSGMLNTITRRAAGSLAIDASGDIYVASNAVPRILRITDEGEVEPVAGTESRGFGGDGGPASDAQLNRPTDMAFAPDGSLFIADRNNHRVRRVTPDGMIETIAGTGASGFSGDGGPAINARLNAPSHVAVGADGTLYISDQNNHRVRKVTPDGVIDTVAGNGQQGFGGDGGMALQARVAYPGDLAVGPGGSLYIASNVALRLRRVGLDGRIETVAGNGESGSNGDGGQATDAQFSYMSGVAVGGDGSLFIADNTVRRVAPSGEINTVAGNGSPGYGVDGELAIEADLSPRSVALGPNGGLFISDVRYDQVVRVGGFIPSSGTIQVPSADGTRIHVFSAAGVHLRTVEALSGQNLYIFQRDASDRLIRIVDGDGNATTIERDSSGAATAIVSPDGQRTLLDVGSQGYLESLSGPESATWSMEYVAGGLLSRLEKPGEAVNRFEYDANGRLISDIDPNGGGWQIHRTNVDGGYRTEMVTGEGRTYRFTTRRPDDFVRVYTAERPDGAIESRIHTDGSTRIDRADGTRVVTRDTPDPRFGSLAPYVSERAIELPSGQERREFVTRLAELSDENDPLSLTRLRESTTVNGRQRTATYDVLDQSWTLESAEGRRTTTNVDGQGRLLSRSVAGIEPVRMNYDTRGRLTTITHGTGSAGRHTRFSYHDGNDQSGYLAAVVDAQNREVTFQTDAVGRLTRQTLPDGRSIDYQYDGRGNLLALIPPGRDAHVFEYDGLSQRTEYTPPDLSGTETVTRYAYNLDRQIREIHGPDGKSVTFGYGSDGSLQTRRMPAGETSYGYDATTGQITSVQSPDGIGLQFTWDGFLPVRTDWTGLVSGTVARSFDDNFWLVEESVNGAALAYTRDDDGFLIEAGDLRLNRNVANGLVTSVILSGIAEFREPNPFGELGSVVVTTGGEVAALDIDVPAVVNSGLIPVTGSMPDADRIEVNGEVIQVADDGGLDGQISLPNIGDNILTLKVFGKALPAHVLAERTFSVERVESQAGGEFPVEKLFDTTSDGGVYVRADDSGAYSGIWFIPAATGEPEKPVWPVSPEEVRVSPSGEVYLRTGLQILDSEGNLVEDFSASGAAQVEEFAVTGDGSIFARTATHELYRAESGQIRLLGTATSGFLNRLDVDSSSWGVGLVSGGTYSEFDASCSSSGGGEGEGETESSFDCFTPVFSASMPSATVSLSDAGTACYLGAEIIQCRRADGSYKYAGFYAQQFELGPNDRLYFLDGSVLKREIGDGETEEVVRILPGSGTGTGSDEAELIVTGSVVGAQDLYDVEFQRDDLGRIVQENETVGGEAHTWRYEYDTAGRLVEVRRDGTPVHIYGYDENGNRTSHTGPSGTNNSAFDGQDRITTYADTTYTHELSGQRASKTTPDGTTTYDYDAAGNLRSVTLPNGSEIEYLIDGRDRRVGKVVDGSIEKGWLYRDQLNPVAQLGADGEVTHRFVYGEKSNVPAYMIKDGTTYRIVSDHVGSVRLVVDTDTQEVVQRIDYSPFGKVVTDTNPGFQPFGFAGGLRDRDTGLVRFGARDYDPEIGRWTAKDPILFGGGTTSLYGYVLNDPVNFVDPDGQLLFNAAGAAAGAIMAGVQAAASGESAGQIAAQMATGALFGALNPAGGIARAAAAAASSIASQGISNGGMDCLNGSQIVASALVGASGLPGKFGKNARDKNLVSNDFSEAATSEAAGTAASSVVTSTIQNSMNGGSGPSTSSRGPSAAR